jgi:hypothetical protein
MIYIDRITLYQLTYIFYYLFNIYKKLVIKYKLNNDIILNSCYITQYDKIHDLYILNYIFNIKICTYFNKKINLLYIYIYQNNKIISKLIIKDNKIINNNEYNIIISIHYMDKYNFYNTLDIYNCGIVNHKNLLINDYYNYKGYKRDRIN